MQTIAPPLVRSRRLPSALRERIALPDGDTLDLAWCSPAPRPEAEGHEHPPHGLAILSHGLEGSIESSYIVGLAHALTAAGYLVMAWNMRGCGGVPNALPSWYHSGKSDDLRVVVEHAHSRHPSLPLFLIGVSIGGNILCKYLGEQGATCADTVHAAVAISAPLDLRGSAEVLAHPSRRLYMEYLLRPLRARIREKALRFPDLFTTADLNAIATFHEFDARYTAPIHGFASIDHYWDTCSGAQYLDGVQVPLLVLSASDDPFLSPSCVPHAIAASSDTIFLETPKHGGHVGFFDTVPLRTTWLERRVLSFLSSSTTPLYARSNAPRTFLPGCGGID